MAHNPIVLRQTVSRLSLDLPISINQKGALFRNQSFVRILNPGEHLSSDEVFSWGTLALYIVDTAPHLFAWQVALPAYGNREQFLMTINLNYRVVDARRMIEDQVQDTELRMMRVLEPLLRSKTREFKLNQYIEVDAAIEEFLRQADFPKLCGTDLVDPPDVQIILTDELNQRIKKLNDLERAMRVTQMAEHNLDAPSKEPAHKFQATVNINYRVTKPDELPTDTLQEAEQQLWARMRGKLRQASRQYTVDQIGEADAAMQDAMDQILDESGGEGFGLRIESISVSTDLEESARQRAVQIMQARHAEELKKVAREGLQAGADFYNNLIRQGLWSVLAVAVAKEEISAESLYERLNQTQREMLDRQMQLLTTLRSENIRDEKQEFEISRRLMNEATNQVLGSSVGPALPPPPANPDQKQLPPSAEEKT